MNGNDFLDKLELVDPAYIEAADAAPQKKQVVWLKWCAIAACLALLLFAGTKFLPQKPPQEERQEEYPDLPMLTFTQNTALYNVPKDIFYGTLETANPWSVDMDLETLPVFYAVLDRDRYVEGNASYAQMRSLLMEIAEQRLGLDMNKVTIQDSFRSTYRYEAGECILTEVEPEPSGVYIETEDFTLSVDSTLTARIRFEESISQPYVFDYFRPEANVKMAEHLKTVYRDLIGCDDPKAILVDHDDSLYIQSDGAISFFDGEGSEVEQILNYNFYRTVFRFDYEGKLCDILIYQPELSTVADYPVITTVDALKLLNSGDYYTNCPAEMPGIEYIKKVDLIYYSLGGVEYYLPFYRFFLELPDIVRSDGEQAYGLFYVPAIPGEYISDADIWETGVLY